MNKASRALRRSSVHLKSIGSGQKPLNMVISEFKNVRSAAKEFAVAQYTAFQEMLKWSSSDENLIFRECFVLLSELGVLWSRVQREFTDRLKDFIHQFEMILEGEQEINEARNNVVVCELRESKLRKDLMKANRKKSRVNINHLEAKLLESQRNKDTAAQKVVDKVRENEAVKIIRIRSGLIRLSQSYMVLAEKSYIVHNAHHKIVHCIPEDQNAANIPEMKCTRIRDAKNYVNKAKDKIRDYHPTFSDIFLNGSALVSQPRTAPPPYYSNQSFSSPYNPHFLQSSPASPSAPEAKENCVSTRSYDNRLQDDNEDAQKRSYLYDAFNSYYDSSVWPGYEEEEDDSWPSGHDTTNLAGSISQV